MSRELEESTTLQLDFQKLAAVAATGAPVLPVVVQHADTGEVLIIAYANQLALNETQRTGLATLWNTSRNELWIKGASSGDYLDVVEIRVNCEQNSLLYKVRPRRGGVCHTRDEHGQTRTSCYYRRLLPDGTLAFVE